MDIHDEEALMRKLRKRRGDDIDDLGEETEEEFLERNFEDPESSDILVEKQVKEGKKKK